MNLTLSPAPHVKQSLTVQKIMLYVLLSLLPATIAGVYFFGIHALMVVLVSVASCVLTEFFLQKYSKRKIRVWDLSSAVTGLLLALVIPPGVPLWIPLIGGIFAITIVKEIFGGLGQNIFNPALASRAFLMASWPTLMTTWLLVDGTTGATPLGILKLEGINAAKQAVSYSNLFFGNVGGSLGETSVLALLIGAAFLFYKKIISWRIPTAYIGTVLILSLLFRLDMLFHLLSGGLIIGAFFMATDYTSSPVTKNGRLIFGFGCGLLTVLIRLYGGYPEGVCYSILIMNMLVPLIDRHTLPKPSGAK